MIFWGVPVSLSHATPPMTILRACAEGQPLHPYSPASLQPCSPTAIHSRFINSLLALIKSINIFLMIIISN